MVPLRPILRYGARLLGNHTRSNHRRSGELTPVAAEAGIPLTHLAMAFAIAHPGVTSAIAGPRTMEQLDDVLAGVDVVPSDQVLDRIDAIAA